MPPKPPFVPVIPAPTSPPAIDASTPLAAPPQFVLGFAQLKQQLGPLMGDPLEDEHSSPDSCDTQQRTTNGLAYWRCSTNVMSFAAAPDGQFHWAWLGKIISWRGDSPDPPADAVAATQIDLLQQACLAALNTNSAGCELADGMSVVGFIGDAGQTNTYRFDVGETLTHVTADLTQLPADYDLYLADGQGTILGTSAQEGLTPEEIDTMLGPGAYYLFVHSDPGRPVDGVDPYTLQLSLAPVTTTAAAAP
jgi:hypothetical protein